MAETIHSFWVEGEFTPHQWLTILSFRHHGHPFVLYTYDKIDGLPSGVEVRDLNEFVPRSKLFHYKHQHYHRRLGGFCEQVKAELLYQLGGWHVDLDVTCLRPFDFSEPYVLRPHSELVVANIIKCPAQSELARIYREGTYAVDESNMEWLKSFAGLAEGVRQLHLDHSIVRDEVFGRDDGDWLRYWRADGGRPDSFQSAIHWCRSYSCELTAEPGSFYDELLRNYGLI